MNELISNENQQASNIVSAVLACFQVTALSSMHAIFLLLMDQSV